MNTRNSVAVPQAVARLTTHTSAPLLSEEWSLDHAQNVATSIYAQGCHSYGEPIIASAIRVSRLLQHIKMPPEVVISGCLCFVPEYLPHWVDKLKTYQANTKYAPSTDILPSITYSTDWELLSTFPEDNNKKAAFSGIISLLEGVAQIRKIDQLIEQHYKKSDQDQAEVLRKMIFTMATDVRTLVIWLAIRVEALRYLQTRPDTPEALSIARTTLTFHAPLANRLGIWPFKWELEDGAFRLSEPEYYKTIFDWLDTTRVERDSLIEEMCASLKSAMQSAGVVATVSGRSKHLYGIHRKMVRKKLSIDNVYDIYALRVLVQNVGQCYVALGVIHDQWIPLGRQFKDYIAKPKGNGYCSLHTTVRGPHRWPIEIQIRTHDMHQYAELGLAAHWRYKEAETTHADQAVHSSGQFDRSVALLRQLLAWQDDVQQDWSSATQSARQDTTIYVLTPEGRIIPLPQGSTAIDFAYALHTELGHRCRGARADGHIIPLDTPLKTGQKVEIITTRTGAPSRDWLNPATGYLVSTKARNKVRQWFNSQERGVDEARGRDILERELRRLGKTEQNLELLTHAAGLPSTGELFLAIAKGTLNLRQISLLLNEHPPEENKEKTEIETHIPHLSHQEHHPKERDGDILVVGIGGLLTRLAGCCKPIPPDPITGFITRINGVSIHRKNCASYQQLNQRYPERVIVCEWGKHSEQSRFPVEIRVQAQQNPSLLSDITDVLARLGHRLTSVQTSPVRNGQQYITLQIEIPDSESLDKTIQAFLHLRSIHRVERINNDKFRTH